MELICTRTDFLKASLGSLGALDVKNFSRESTRAKKEAIEHNVKETHLNAFDKFVLGENNSRLLKGLAVLFGVCTGGLVTAGVYVKCQYLLRDATDDGLRIQLCEGIDSLPQIKPATKDAYKRQINQLDHEELELIRDAVFEVYTVIQNQMNDIVDSQARLQEMTLWVSNDKKATIYVKDWQLCYRSATQNVVLKDAAEFIAFSHKAALPDERTLRVGNLHCRGMQLDNLNLMRSVLSDSDFAGAHIENMNFADATFKGDVSFRRAHFSYVNLAYAKVSGGNSRVDFTGAVLDNADISHTNFKNMVLDDVTVNLVFPDDEIAITLSGYLAAIQTIPPKYPELKKDLLSQIMTCILERDHETSDALWQQIQRGISDDGLLENKLSGAAIEKPDHKKKASRKESKKEQQPIPLSGSAEVNKKERITWSSLGKLDQAALKKAIQEQHPALSGTIKLILTAGDVVDVDFEFKECGSMSNVYRVTMGESSRSLEVKWPGYGQLNYGKVS